jgi:hypothetical protein
MAHPIWFDTEHQAERWSDPAAADTESLLAEVSVDSPLVYAISAISATEDGPPARARGLGGDRPEAGDSQDDPAERQFLDGLILAGLVYP